MPEELVKSILNKLDTMLEFDESIDVDSVEELKSKYDTFVKENFPETTILYNANLEKNKI